MRYSTSVPHLSRQSWFSRPAASRSRRNNISKLWTPGQDSTFTASTDEAIGSTALFSKFPCVKACKDQNHLTRYQYQTLAEWAGAVALHSTEGGFKELPPPFVDALSRLLRDAKASRGTTVYALALFRPLWREKGNLRMELIPFAQQGRLLPGMVSKYPGEVLVLGTFYWALWAATVTLCDTAYSFPWIAYLMMHVTEGRRFQAAVLRDLDYRTLIPSRTWKMHLHQLLSDSRPLEDHPAFQFVVRTLEAELQKAS